MALFNGASSSRLVADEILRRSMHEGDTADDCEYDEKIFAFVDEHASAATLQGWITTVDEIGHNLCEYVMAFICVHPYLSEMFDDHILQQMVLIGGKSIAGYQLLYKVFGDSLPEYTLSLDEPNEVIQGAMTSFDRLEAEWIDA